MGKIHELFVLALSLVWFAGATPELPEVFTHSAYKMGVFHEIIFRFREKMGA